MARPEDLLLAFLYECRRDTRNVTQRDLVRSLSLSQPSVSRVLQSLRSEGSVQASRSGMWTGRNPEQIYSLTDAGLLRAPAAYERILEMPSSAAGFSIRDLVDLNGGTSTFDLGLASVRGIAIDPTDPRAAIDQLNHQRGGVSMASVESGRSSGETAEVRSTAVVGRAEERLVLFSQVRDLTASPPHGGALMLLGTAGAGKTRLLRFVRDVARGRNLPVMESHVLVGTGPVLTPLSGMLFGGAGDRPWTLPLPRVRGSTVSRLLGALRAVEEMSTTHPQVILFDDLHRAPRETVEFFHLLSRAIQQRNLPILALGTGRDDEPPEAQRNGFLQLVEDAGRTGTGSVRIIPVPALSADEAQRLAGQLGGKRMMGRPGDRSIGEVLRRARGNPLFIVEGIRDLVDRQLIRESAVTAAPSSDPTPSRRDFRVPLSLRKLLQDRFELLPYRERTVLGVASLLGQEFDVEPLLQVGTTHRLGTPAQLAQALRRLEERYRYLQKVDRHRYEFAHPLVFLTVRESFPDGVAWSGRFERWWETHRSTDLSTLARLSHDARDARRGIGWVDRAIDRAVDTHAWDAVGELLRWRRDLIGQLPEMAGRTVDRDWEVLRRMWHAGAARETYEILHEYLALPLAPARRLEAEILLVNALAAVDPGEARRRLVRLEGERSRAPSRSKSERGQFAAARAFSEIQSGQWFAAERTARTALDLVDEHYDPDTRAWALYSWSVALLHLHRLEESWEVCQQGRGLAARNDLGSLLALVADTEARIRLISGDPQSALPILAQGEIYARQIDSSVPSARILANRALAEIRLRRWDRALATTDALREISDRLDLPVHAAWTDYRYGQIAMGQRRWPDARTRLLAATSEFDRMGLTIARDLSRIQLAVVRGETGDSRIALEEVDALEPQVALTDADERPALAGVRGRLNERLGRIPVAQAEYRKMLEESRRSGDRLREAEALAELARLESAHGSARAGLALARLSHAQFVRLGVRLASEPETPPEVPRDLPSTLSAGSTGVA